MNNNTCPIEERDRILLASNKDSEYAPWFERMIDVLTHPWNPEEAHRY